MEIRRAQKDDLPAIVRLLADDPLGSQREQYDDPLPESYQSAFTNIDQDQNQELMVAVDLEGSIIGTLQLSFLQYLTYQGGLRAQIEAVRIRKDQRVTGLRTQLFQWAIERTKTRGAHVLQLTTDKKRPEAMKFYHKLGFVASHEGMKMHFR